MLALGCNEQRQKPPSSKLEEVRVGWREAEENLLSEMDALVPALEQRRNTGADEVGELLHAMAGARNELRKAHSTALSMLESGPGSAAERLEASSSRMMTSMKKAEALVERARELAAQQKAVTPEKQPEGIERVVQERAEPARSPP
jgi:hypothetical protein